MMKTSKYLLLSVFIVLFFEVFSQKNEEFFKAENIAEIKQKITNTSAEINSLSSNFTQEKHLTMMEEILISKGNFQYKKENMVRWTYTQPIDYAIILNENHFVILNDGKASSFDISSSKMFSEINQMIVMAIKGNFLESKEFSSEFFENTQFYKIALSPLNGQVAKMLINIEIYFNKSDMSVQKVKFIEPGDDFTLIIFSERKLNSDIPDNIFTLKNE